MLLAATQKDVLCERKGRGADCLAPAEAADASLREEEASAKGEQARLATTCVITVRVRDHG